MRDGGRGGRWEWRRRQLEEAREGDERGCGTGETIGMIGVNLPTLVLHLLLRAVIWGQLLTVS